jgi:hypothetical protein
MTPTMIPTVAIDAWSNCKMTSDATIHAMPKTSHSHQKLVISGPAAGSSATMNSESRGFGVVT